MIENLIERVKKEFMFIKKRPKYIVKLTLTERSLEEVTLVASMAHHGLLGFFESIVLKDLDLRSVPSDQLAPLFSNVTRRVDFWNISGCGPFMDILKCDVVGVFGQSLGIEETRALVQAMETRVRMITLGGCVTLHWTRRPCSSTAAKGGAASWPGVIRLRRS